MTTCISYAGGHCGSSGPFERAEVEADLSAGPDLAVIASSCTNRCPHGFAIQAPDSVSREALTATAHAAMAAGTSSQPRRAPLAAPTHTTRPRSVRLIMAGLVRLANTAARDALG